MRWLSRQRSKIFQLSLPMMSLNFLVGSNVLVGEEPSRLAEAVGDMVAGRWKSCGLPEQWDGRTGERIVKILES